VLWLVGVRGRLSVRGFGVVVWLGGGRWGVLWLAGVVMERFAPGGDRVVAGAVGRESDK